MWSLGDYRGWPVASRPPSPWSRPGDRAGDGGAGGGRGTGTWPWPRPGGGPGGWRRTLTPRMVELGRERSAAEGLDIEWREADAEELPFEDGRFDVAASTFGAVFRPPPPVRTASLHRQLGPGVPGQARLPWQLRRVPDRRHREPDSPEKLIDYSECSATRATSSDGRHPRSLLELARAARGDLDGEPVPTGVFPGGWEGLHVFDISDLSDPDLVASVETECGSHTATAVPDPANNRLLVYNNPSTPPARGSTSSRFRWTTRPAPAYLRFEPAGRSCHDTGVILGDAMKAACAGGNGFTTWSLDPADGGSLENPAQLYSTTVPGVTIGHSAGFTWDGKVLIFGHEPGGGAAARCQATSSITDRTLFFFDADTGAALGTIVHPRPQTATRTAPGTTTTSCPPTSGTCWSAATTSPGISVVDFSDPANAKEIAYADPAPLSRRRSSSSAATGRPTGTTGASTSPTSPAGCWSGTSATLPPPAPASLATSIPRHRNPPSGSPRPGQAAHGGGDHSHPHEGIQLQTVRPRWRRS